MRIWQHIHTVATTEVSPDLGELAEILDDVSVEMIPLRYCWGCRTCQTNKKRKLKYGHLPAKTIIRIPWEALCVDLIGPYTLKGKDGSQIDFMAMLEVIEEYGGAGLMTHFPNMLKREIEADGTDMSNATNEQMKEGKKAVREKFLAALPQCQWEHLVWLMKRAETSFRVDQLRQIIS